MRYNVNFDIELKRNSYGGLYIALEGIDGSGKTTQVKKLSDYFKSKGKKVLVTREPRKEGLIGDLVREILVGKIKVPSVSLQYLFSAERSIHHQEVIIPALKKGKVVITDRCFWSAIVYGILDRTEGKYDKSDADLLLISQSILSMYHQFTVPDFTFYLRISLEESLKRLSEKKEEKEIYENKEKIEKVLTGYNFLQERFPKEIKIVEGEGEISEITNRMIKLIKHKL